MIVPDPVTLVVPDSISMPHEVPLVPWLAALRLKLLPPVTDKFPARWIAELSAPVPLVICPKEMVRFTGTVNVAPTLSPWPEVPEPPTQLLKAIELEKVAAAPMLTPKLEVPAPPVQELKVTVFEVPGVQGLVLMETP